MKNNLEMSCKKTDVFVNETERFFIPYMMGGMDSIFSNLARDVVRTPGSGGG